MTLKRLTLETVSADNGYATQGRKRPAGIRRFATGAINGHSTYENLEARIFAMAIVDILMFASAWITERYVQPRRYDARSMRMDWLWPLLPQASLDLLIQRIRKWPADYVRECWPELENIEKVSMLQRKRKLISQRLSREKPSAERLSLANIRAN